ncbi:MAG: rRNA maturation RNase YbeY [Candidatus Dormibacteraeota bacterium]|uniref:Endoribonuclease YbeY n=1 Tax=Candidatus Dormiibacter inghamiae TaxID=3127013 RepID=A0A934NGQ7_9BACT|nr:rRNA maturation RNase YbeY [Candidatus Dormibacteraeota bacterium]MBJ7605105.1 rRNA maturation RNase YbeY [Candidatus Dormibacteraeota bacterium]
MEVRKTVAAPLRPIWFRQVFDGCCEEPAVAALLPADAQLTLLVAGDRTLRRLNRRFLGEDQPTDVLSFPSGGGDEPGYLGDLAISWPTVQRQARHYCHPVESEAGLLIVHGLLHLLGFDHADRAGEKVMTRLTWSCLNRLDLGIGARRLASA